VAHRGGGCRGDEAEQLLDRRGEAGGAAVEVGGELRGDHVGPEQGAGEVADPVDGQRVEDELEPARPGREVGAEVEGWGVREILAPVGEHEAEVRRELGGEEAEQLAGVPVGPVQVLDDQDGRAEGAQQLEYGAEAQVALCPPVGGRVRRRWQPAEVLREQGPERADHRAEPVGWRVVAVHGAEGLDHGAERERLPHGVAVAVEGAPAAGRRAGCQLPHQPGLADARLALDDRDGGPPLGGVKEDSKLPIALDQRRRSGASTKKLAIPQHARPPASTTSLSMRANAAMHRYGVILA
jgi:hypothetical protein